MYIVCQLYGIAPLGQWTIQSAPLLSFKTSCITHEIINTIDIKHKAETQSLKDQFAVSFPVQEVSSFL